MASNALTHLSLEQLRRVVSIKEKIAALESELARVVNGSSRARSSRVSPPKMSSGGGSSSGQGPKRKVSASARAKLRAIAKARWAKAKAAGKLLAERAKAQGITKVVFDRSGYRYHGRVQAVADGAREGGLEF